MPDEAMTLREFFDAAQISASYFYALPPEQRPQILRLSPRKQFVTRAAFEQWVKRRNKQMAAA